MTKFDNYVFMSICEISLDLFDKSNFSTYLNYCKTLNLSLKSGILDKKETYDIINISNKLILIYGFDEKTCAEYIAKYFDCDRFLEFQKCVLITKKFFGNSLN